MIIVFRDYDLEINGIKLVKWLPCQTEMKIELEMAENDWILDAYVQSHVDRFQ